MEEEKKNKKLQNKSNGMKMNEDKMGMINKTKIYF